MARRGTVLLTATLVLLATPAVLLGWLRLRAEDRLAELEPSPLPVVVEVEEVLVDDRQAVNLSFSWGAAREVVAPSWAGTVTAVHVARGREVESGDLVVTVDGLDRIAAASDVPFWRPLGRDDTGPDVLALQELLASLGLHENEIDGRYGPATTSAANALAHELGIALPNGVFDPAWVVWLPFDPFPIDGIEAEVGRQAPAHGDLLLMGPSTISEIRMTDSQGAPLRLDGDWLLEVAGADYELVDGELTADARDGLSRATEREVTELVGRVRRANPVVAVEIPATGVTSNAAGAVCVLTPDGVTFSPMPVTIDGGRVARVFVISGLEPGDEILVNPAEVLDNPVCP